MLHRSALFPVAAICLTVSCVAHADILSDRTALLNGVSEIAAPGIPGSLCLIGDKAFPVVVGKAGNSVEPVVAASYLGKGRVAAFGHDGYLNEEALKTADTGKLLMNAVRWASGGKAKPRVAVLERWSGTLAYLKAQGIDAVAIPEKGGAAKLTGYDVVIGMLSVVPREERGAYKTFAEKGGGLILAETGWGWQMINSGAPLYQNGSSEVLSASGILFADGMLDRTSANGFITTGTFPETINAQKAIDLILSGKSTPAESKQAMAAVSRALQALPPDDKFILPRLRTLAKASSSDFSDITTKPIKMDAPADRLAFTFAVREVMALPIDQMKAAPSANAFPGAVPADAKRVTQTVTVNGNRGAREGTGLYAAPGDVVTITVPKTIVGKGVEVRIGAHTDTLWHLDSWKRAPQVSRTFPVNAETIKVGNAFGGTIYLDMPEKEKLGDVPVTIAGAVLQPRFVLGKTTPTDWKHLKDAPGPWAELEGENCILTVPSYAVRELDDPEALMTYWDEVLANVADLYQVPRHRPRPERYCVDVQISAGYMHSGYPIMTWDDVAKTFTDLKILRGNNGFKTWGFYHEVGHNYQVEDWTWDGCGEVTNNLFSLYGGEKLNQAYKDGEYQNTHPAVLPKERNERLAKYRAEGPSFEKWKNDPFLALIMFIELRKAFGWEPFQKVFAEYTKLPKDQHPKTDEEKRDQFMVRFSRTTGKNLGPFFQAWAVPTSEAARKSIANLPVWMPDEMK